MASGTGSTGRPACRWRELYEQRLRVLEEADRAGFYCYHLAEHHGTPLSAAPSAEPLLRRRRRSARAACGSARSSTCCRCTTRCAWSRRSPCSTTSRGGRLEVGVGRGASPYELAMFGITPEAAPELFREALDVLVQGLATGDLTYEGRHFQLRDTRPTLRPLQQPYPPLWYPDDQRPVDPLDRPRGLQHHLRLRLPVADPGGHARAARPLRRACGRARRRAGATERPRGGRRCYGFTRQVYVAETDAQALREARAAFADFFANFNYLWALHDNDRYSGRVRLRPAGRAEA